MNKDDHRYDDILHLPHHVSSRRSRMSDWDRAAQFSPFAALTGYDATVRETARLVGRRTILAEDGCEELDRKHQRLLEHLSERPEITVTYFVPDLRKEGGEYVTVTGRLEKLIPTQQLMILERGRRIFLEEIRAMESPLFKDIL